MNKKSINYKAVPIKYVNTITVKYHEAQQDD